MGRRHLSLVAIWAVCACYKRVPPEITTPASISVEGSSLEWRASIPTMIRNPSRDLIQLDWNPTLQQNTSRGWRPVDGVFSAGREPVRPVGPLDSVLISFVKEESRDMRIIMCRGPLSTGEYRLRFGWWRFENGKEHKLDTVTSRPFTLVIPEFANAQVPKGFHLGAHVQLPDSLVESRAEGGFHIEIVRIARDTASRRALIIAESVFPDASEIERAAARETSPFAGRLREVAAPPGDRWWWDNFDLTLTPYAVTGSAVDYYVARIRALSDTTNPFREAKDKRHNGRLSYRATVIEVTDPGAAVGGHIVHMALAFHYSCGMLCGMEFRVSRDVVVSKDGRILEVRGDGRPVVIVS